jgi:hypothetical protein
MNKRCKEMEFHINARCACLLEVAKAKNKREVTSTSKVQYLHRTARDFLEHEERWNEVLERTRDTSFDLNYSMMRCYYFMLHWVCRGDGNPSISERRLKRLRTTALQVLLFASLVDADGKFHAQEVRMLDDIKEKLQSLFIYLDDGRGMTWLAPAEPISTKPSIIICALVLNLSTYMAAKLRNLHNRDVEAARMACTRMLHNHVHRVNFTQALPPMNLKIASLLLEFGASVNDKDDQYPRMSIWEAYLDHAFNNLTSGQRDPAPDFAQIMERFLSSGADPHARVQHLSLSGFFDTYVRPNYPNVDGLHERITQLILTNQHKPRDSQISMYPLSDTLGKCSTTQLTISNSHRDGNPIDLKSRHHTSRSIIEERQKQNKRNWWQKLF